MRPLPPDCDLVLATHNAGKLREFQELLAPFGARVRSAAELGLPEPEETGTSFIENALLKARAAATATGQIALADDSGLCVNALDGAPGLYSGRYAERTPGAPRDFAFAMQRLHDAIGASATPEDRSAYFICVLAIVWPDGHQDVIEGRAEGDIVWPPQGDHGHGYDPVFRPRGEARSFAQMPESEKNLVSHRGRAVGELVRQLRSTAA